MKVIKYSHIPARAPVVNTVLAMLALDHWQAPGWVYGATWTFLVLSWLTWATLVCAQDMREPEWK